MKFRRHKHKKKNSTTYVQIWILQHVRYAVLRRRVYEYTSDSLN